jgi:HAD superfamily hydrolase (TIGR01549 family)
VKRPIKVVLLDLGNTLFYDDPAAWPGVYERAEEALWASLSTAGVQSTPEILYGSRTTLLQYYYDLRETGLDEPGTGPVLDDLLAEQGFRLPRSRLQEALRSMYAVTQTNWRLEQDAIPTLSLLRRRGLRLGAVSNGADDRNARELLDRAGLRPYFEAILTSAAYGRRKPDPGIFRAILRRLNASPQESVMVGDSYEADIIGSHGLGMSTIWITRRLGTRALPQAIVPDATITALGEIPDLVS